MITGIYKIQNILNNKIYVGSASSNGGFRKRWNEHKSGLRRNKHTNKHLQSSWNKYGEESFVFEIIETCCVENVLEKEQYYINLLQPEYNICKIAGNTLGIKLSNNHKKQISEFAKLRVGDKNPFYGKKHSEETKKFNSEQMKERINKNGPLHFGIKHSEETKNKQSKVKLGKKSPLRIPVYQLDLNDKIIKLWESATHAAKGLNKSDGNIISACKGRLKIVYGFKWKYA